MNTQYWRTQAIKDGQTYDLYTYTSDEQVAEDLKLSTAHSLITIGRLGIFPGPNSEARNHMDLALGTFSSLREFRLTTGKVTKCDTFPEKGDLDDQWLGGSGQTFLMSVRAVQAN